MCPLEHAAARAWRRAWLMWIFHLQFDIAASLAIPVRDLEQVYITLMPILSFMFLCSLTIYIPRSL